MEDTSFILNFNVALFQIVEQRVRKKSMRAGRELILDSAKVFINLIPLVMLEKWFASPPPFLHRKCLRSTGSMSISYFSPKRTRSTHEINQSIDPQLRRWEQRR
jgi:hypothetical protein